MKLHSSISRYWIIFLFFCCVFVSTSNILIASSSEDDINKDAVFGPGDRKHGYDQETYVTNSISVTARKGKQADLLQFFYQTPLGLPKMDTPDGKPITEEKVSLVANARHAVWAHLKRSCSWIRASGINL